MSSATFQPGSIVEARGREWIVLPESTEQVLHLRTMGGHDDDVSVVCPALERMPIRQATFGLPSPEQAGNQASGRLLQLALKLKLRAGAGPFRSFGSINVEPRAYQLVPLMMALKLSIVRMLIADDVGIGKTIEACLIVRELLDRGEVDKLCVLCPPHLCEQWQSELAHKFNIRAEVVRTSTAARLERGLGAHQSIFRTYPYTIVSLDYIKSDRRRDEFKSSCPSCVIVDEAHACTRGFGRSRHQRFSLLQGLAQDENRHMVLLTATPHSGDEEAFYNLLGLLKPEFAGFAELTSSRRSQLREKLAAHFVQRRRADIDEWRDSAVFPVRLTKKPEPTYRMDGALQTFFNRVRDHAREIVVGSSGKSAYQQRLSWWAALALLRCVSSSPAAAEKALATRLDAVRPQDADNEEQLRQELEHDAMQTVMDGEGTEELSLTDLEPGGATGDTQDVLTTLVKAAQSLQDVRKDPKLACLLSELRELVKEGYRPVIFCRYIATAHYLCDCLKKEFPSRTVDAVTGELAPLEREQRVESLRMEDSILVATDCLSEGVNLQEVFDAVVHYDLSWNPTRHEQREGRVDRFGQPSKKVKVVMIYGENNPVDGAVLQVILRKADTIRRELGVLVPMPDDEERVSQAIIQSVLLKRKDADPRAEQLTLDLSLPADPEKELHVRWENAKEQARQNRTIFAQRGLKPAEVLPEFGKATSILGGSKDVSDFVSAACEALGAPLDVNGTVHRIPHSFLPKAVTERLGGTMANALARVAFELPLPPRARHINRTHVLVSSLADYVAEGALSGERPEIAARSGAIFTRDVAVRTLLLLMRLRCQITYARQGVDKPRILLAEKAMRIAVQGDEITEGDAVESVSRATPERNMADAARARQIEWGLTRVNDLKPRLDELADQHARLVLEDHRRIRDAADARGSYRIEAVKPVDVIGLYVLVPTLNL